MFKKPDIDALFDELKAEFGGCPDYEELLRDAHLGIAYADVDRPSGDEIDARVATLIEKHRPRDG